MRLWPRSLFGRTALLIAAVVLLSQMLSAALLYYSYSGARLERAAFTLATEFKILALALDTLPAPRREQYIRELAVQHKVLVLPGTDTPDARTPDSYAVRVFEKSFRAQFDQPVSLRWQRGRLWLAWPPAQANVWIGVPFVPRKRELFWRVVGVWLVFGGMVGALGALLVVRYINRPLHTLARAAVQVGQGETPRDLPQGGPTEIAALSRAFNQMARDVQRLSADRVLLLAGVSHDLRTPLARLRLALEMLGDNTDATLTQGMIQDIDDMDRIIEQFIAYVRDGEMESACATDLNDLVQTTAARYLRQGHVIALDLAPLPVLAMRSVAMQRLLANLIDNALRHGGGEIEVRTRMHDGRTALSVLDRGPGPATMPPNDQASAYRPRLGLVVVERIAQLHQGRLQLLVRDGGGLEARVEFALPVCAM